MIEIKNLTKIYGTHLAVDHLNVTFENGKIYGFLGPNGAGKSTTMNMITGYLAPTEGDVIIDGHSILTEPNEAKKRIGYLPELPPLYMDMTVDEYLTFAARLKQIPKAEVKAQVKRVVKLARLEDVHHRLIRNLSKGYRQRVGVAQAILGNPKMLILDEPTVGLDPKQIIEIRDLIHELSKTQTIILSSHILSEVQAVCDHILIIHKGKLLANDTPENLERALADEDALHLQLAAPAERVKAMMKEIPSIKAYELEEEGDLSVLQIPCGDGSDPRVELFRACAKADCPIVSMEFSKSNLEDVFLRLTHADAQAYPEKTKRAKKEG